eukprot:m.188810 g.188810  ORF g.188810 m.188810 type:complete len:1238 (-) comp17539_c0_seq3:327-4040(-)
MEPVIQPSWKSMTVPAVLTALDSRVDGLTSEEADARLQKYGRNVLPAPPRRTWLHRIRDQLNSILVYILLLAAVAELIFRIWLDAGVILMVVVLNVTIGLIQEGKAESAAKAISGMLAPVALVVRDHATARVDAATLVAGDIVLLSAGDRVPADMRVMVSSDLQTQEAILTGEGEPVNKRVDPVEADAALAEAKSMVFSGTMVVYGQGKGVVVATGAEAEIGRISALMNQVDRGETPLVRQFSQFGRWVSVLTFVIASTTFLVDYLAQDSALQDAVIAAIGIAVAFIPDGLRAVVTVTLALAVSTMAKHSAIVRRLPTVETLGCVSVICTDKTGTLTKNEMTVTTFVTPGEEYTVTGVGYEPVGQVLAKSDNHALTDAEQKQLEDSMMCGILCNTSSLAKKGDRWEVVGNPTEGSLLAFSKKANPRLDWVEYQKAHPTIFSIPFQSEYKFMATVHDLPAAPGSGSATQRVALIKGAPDRLLARCATQAVANNPWRSEPLDREEWSARIDTWGAKGFRVLALCRLNLPDSQTTFTKDDVLRGEPRLQLDALVAIVDPPRDEVIPAIEACHTAGITVKMITGDSPLTALTIGERIGIATPYALTGAELNNLSDEELTARVLECNIYARVTPEHKLRVVKALLRHGKVTAMTGDGVNDAPALKQASVGVAMGITGTEVAKEAAEMILADDNFATIEVAVREGRTVYDNLLKILSFVLPTNFAQGLSIAVAIWLGLGQPLEALQVLYVNMITSVTLGIVLSLEESENDIMERAPRSPHKPLLGKWLMWRTFLVTALSVAFILGNREWQSSLGGSEDEGRTVAMVTMNLSQCFYVFNCRYLRYSSLILETFYTNLHLNAAVLLNIMLLILIVHTPGVSGIFNVASLTILEWLRCLMFGAAIFAIVELDKFTGPFFISLLRPVWRMIRRSCLIFSTSCAARLLPLFFFGHEDTGNKRSGGVEGGSGPSSEHEGPHGMAASERAKKRDGSHLSIVSQPWELNVPQLSSAPSMTELNLLEAFDDEGTRPVTWSAHPTYNSMRRSRSSISNPALPSAPEWQALVMEQQEIQVYQAGESQSQPVISSQPLGRSASMYATGSSAAHAAAVNAAAAAHGAAAAAHPTVSAGGIPGMPPSRMRFHVVTEDHPWTPAAAALAAAGGRLSVSEAASPPPGLAVPGAAGGSNSPRIPSPAHFELLLEEDEVAAAADARAAAAAAYATASARAAAAAAAAGDTEDLGEVKISIV